MRRFTAYRRNLSARGTHTAVQANPDDQPQFEGVVWTDGTCTIRWLTAKGSTAVWDCLMDMLMIHGHPEYGTDIVWHDWPEGVVPHEWTHMLDEAKQCLLPLGK